MSYSTVPGSQDREYKHLFEDLDRPPVYASFLRRLGGLFIDGIILSIGNQILLSLLGFSLWDRELNLPANAIATLTAWLYYALQESGPARATIGKRAVAIQVCGLDGQRISFGQATGRYFGHILSALILLIGYLMMLWDRRSQTLHDKLADTLVVKEPNPYRS